MQIRKAEQSDIAQITRVIQDSYSTVAKQYDLTPANCPKHPSNCTAQWIERDFARGVHYYVVESDDKILGCMALEKASEHTCYLERLAVIPEQRNRGVGMMLVNDFIQKASEIGVSTIGIGIISKQDNLKRWYEKLGFIKTGEKTFDHLPFDVAFMEYHIQK
ncbi:MAG: N-acetyltransferase [Desulfobulbaceae bacterium]|nr:MAG: N-acetyltransferase [Desulfobulbaceae bacterium]